MRFFKYILVVAALFLVTACHHSHSDQKIIKVGLSSEYPPFEFKRNGELAGFDVDLSYALAKQLNVTVQFVDMDFHSLISALNSGKVDMLISAMAPNAQRAKHVDFSKTYYQANFALVYLKDKSPHSLQSLAGQKVGVQMGSTMELLVKTQPSIKPVALASNAVLIEQLKLGRVNAVLMENMQAMTFASINNKVSYHVLGNTGQGYAIAFVKNSAWQTKTQAALDKLEQQKILKLLAKKWLGEQS